MLAWLRKFRKSAPRFCNIGGGPNFAHRGWVNLDGVGGPKNPAPFTFSPTCRFPLAASTMELVYSSHALEHFDDATVARALAEALRVLRPDGRLIIKIPDFSAAQRAWAVGDAEWFADTKWNFPVVTGTFHNRGVIDTLNARAAYLFCGFWNPAYGNLFGRFDVDAPGAYNGPPALSDSDLAAILAQQSPHRIAADLRAAVVRTESEYTFNHQNAWSGEEFTALLGRHGFSVRATDFAEIAKDNHHIPEFEVTRDISAYYLATPTTVDERAARWSAYDARIPRSETSISASFDETRMHAGKLEPELAARALGAMQSAQKRPFRTDDATPGYVTAYFDPDIERTINEQSDHRESAELRAAIAEVLTSLRDEVAVALGSPWRVLNFRCFITPPGGPGKYMNDWHSDGFCPMSSR